MLSSRVSASGDPVARLRSVMAFRSEAVASNAQARRVLKIAMYKLRYVEEMAAIRIGQPLLRRVLRRSLPKGFGG